MDQLIGSEIQRDALNATDVDHVALGFFTEPGKISRSTGILFFL